MESVIYRCVKLHTIFSLFAMHIYERHICALNNFLLIAITTSQNVINTMVVRTVFQIIKNFKVRDSVMVKNISGNQESTITVYYR